MTKFGTIQMILTSQKEQKMKLTTLTLALSLALATSGHALAADKKDDKKDKTIAELIKDKTEFAGIFSLYQDEKPVTT